MWKNDEVLQPAGMTRGNTFSLAAVNTRVSFSCARWIITRRKTMTLCPAYTCTFLTLDGR